MKKLLTILSLLASTICFSQTRPIQPLGTKANEVKVLGALSIDTALFVTPYATLAAADVPGQYARTRGGSLIFVKNENTLYIRNDAATAWLKIALGSTAYTLLSQFVDEPAWQMYYSNAAGDVTPFAFGASATVLTSNGINAPPTWQAVADASATNELQTYAHTGTTSYTNTLSNGGGSFTIQAAGINTISHSAGTITITGTEVDGSVSNELQTLASTSNATSHTVTLSNSGGSFQLVESGIVTLTTTGTGLNGIITIGATEVDGSVSNELQTYAHSGTTSYTNTLSQSGGSFTLQSSGIVTISNTGGTVTIGATEVDGSVSNELQTLASISDATSHTVTLSNSGGSIKFVEGANITLTTTGTGLDAIITIASTAAGGGFTTLAQFVTEPVWSVNYSNSLGDIQSLTVGAAGTVFHGNGVTSAPTWAAVSLTADVSGDLPFSSFVQGAANTVVTNPTAALADFTTTALAASNLLGRGSTGNIAPITVGGILSFSGAVLSATEVDGSITNELQTISNTSDATSHTITLSNSGGTIQFIEGTGVTLTTGGTSSAGTLTINASGGGGGTILGSIADDQVAVGSAANTIEGTSALTFPTATYLSVSTAGQSVTGSGFYQLNIQNTAAYSTTPGAGILFQNKYNAAGAQTWMGGILAIKDNAVDGDYGSRLILWNRENGGSSLYPAFEINSDQEVLVGNAGADFGDYKLQVRPKTITEVGQAIILLPSQAVDALQVKNSSAATLARISKDGYGVFPRVGAGLGATDPSYPLHVLGESFNEYTAYFTSNYYLATGSVGINSTGSPRLTFLYNDVAKYTTMIQDAVRTDGVFDYSIMNNQDNRFALTIDGTNEYVGMGTRNTGADQATLPQRRLHLFEAALGYESRPLLRLTTASVSGHVVGFGTGIETELGAGDYDTRLVASYVDTKWSDVTVGSFDADYVVSLMQNSAAVAEKMRVLSTGELKVQLLNQDNAENNVVVWNATDKIFEYRAASTIGGGTGGGYTTLVQFVDETAWRMYYSNASGDVTAFALGTSGQVLQSNGASAAPSWVTPSGSGWQLTGNTLAATGIIGSLNAFDVEVRRNNTVYFKVQEWAASNLNKGLKFPLISDYNNDPDVPDNAYYFSAGTYVGNPFYEEVVDASSIRVGTFGAYGDKDHALLFRPTTSGTRTDDYAVIESQRYKGLRLGTYQAENSVAGAGFGSVGIDFDRTNYVLFTPSGNTSWRKIDYSGNIHGLFTNYSLVTKKYVDSLIALGGGADVVFTNGLTESVANTGELGGTLTKNTTLSTTSSFTLTVSGGNSALTVAPMAVYNPSGGLAMDISSFGGADGTIWAAGIGKIGASAEIVNALFVANGTAAADGMGVRFAFKNATSSSSASTAAGTSNELISQWLVSNNATRQSLFTIKGVNSGTLRNIVELNGSGSLKLNLYTTVGSFSGTAVGVLGFDASGNILTMATPSGGSGITVGTTTVTGGTSTRILYNNAGVVGEYAVSGTGSVTMSNYPAFVATATNAAFNITPIGSNPSGAVNSGDIWWRTNGFLYAYSSGVREFTWNDATQTLTNKTLTSPIMTSPNFTTIVSGSATLTLPTTVTGSLGQYVEASIVSNATWSPQGDARDNYYDITLQAANVTAINAPTGTPVNHNTLLLRVRSDGTIRTITGWNAIYRGGTTLALPAATTASKTMYIKFIYNSNTTTWDCVSVLDGL